MERLTPLVLGFAGRIKSGKTTISQAVAESLQWPRASFGEYVRSIAESRGLDPKSREQLQDLGESLIAESWPRFCQRVLDASGWKPGNPVVVDGIRHVEAIDHVTAIVAPLPFRLVYVRVPPQVQAARLLESDAARNLAAVESHSTETDVKDELPKRANLVVEGREQLDQIVAEIRHRLVIETD